MQDVFKPFGGRATGSFSERFHHSRLVLTAVYVVILAVILSVSGGTTRQIFSQRLSARFNVMDVHNTGSNVNAPRPPRAEDVRQDLQSAIVLVHGSLLVIAGVLSYWLAGLTLRPIERSYERQRQFVADASHELRTPLAILQTQLENAKGIAKTPHDTAVLEGYLEEVGRMSHIVRDLLTLSRMDDADVGTVTFAPVNAQIVIDNAITRLQIVAATHQVDLKQISDPKDVLVYGYEEWISQAVVNVLKNAIVYNKPQGTVEVNTGEQDGTWFVRVKDTGIGMSEEELAHVFDRFYRPEKSRSRETGGSGLGLAIVQAAMHRMHGTIDIESTQNVGTTVTLTFPIHKTS